MGTLLIVFLTQIYMQKIIPHLWYNKEAKQAVEYYVKVFNGNPFNPDKKESKINSVTLLRDTSSGDCDLVEYQLDGQEFMAISAGPAFTLNEAASFLIKCNSQEEIDYFWEKLSHDPESEACGWCKDRFGLSWQVWTPDIATMLQGGEQEKIVRMQAELMKMKKFDLETLRRAFNGE